MKEKKQIEILNRSLIVIIVILILIIFSILFISQNKRPNIDIKYSKDAIVEQLKDTKKIYVCEGISETKNEICNDKNLSKTINDNELLENIMSKLFEATIVEGIITPVGPSHELKFVDKEENIIASLECGIDHFLYLRKNETRYVLKHEDNNSLIKSIIEQE